MPRRSRETEPRLPLVLRGTGSGQDPVTLDRLRSEAQDGGFRDDEGTPTRRCGHSTTRSSSIHYRTTGHQESRRPWRGSLRLEPLCPISTSYTGREAAQGAEAAAIRPTGSSASEPSHEAAVQDVQNLRSESLGLSRDKSPNVVTSFGREAAHSVFVVKPPIVKPPIVNWDGRVQGIHNILTPRANATKPAIAHYDDTRSRIQPRH